MKQVHNYINAFFSLLFGKLLSVYKLSFVVGSYALMFSASSLCLPLVGRFSGIGGATVTWAILLAIRLMAGAWSLSTLAFYIPGYVAAFYLATQSRFVRCGIPALMMILFVMHPVGAQAALYSCFWLIPILVGAGFGRSFFATALGATFTAHAVGSVIWLYTVPMASAAWLALIPVVALERVTFAAGLVVMHQLIVWLTQHGSVLAWTVRRSSLFSVR